MAERTDHRFCEQCGAQLVADAAFCTRCGHTVEATTATWPGQAAGGQPAPAPRGEPQKQRRRPRVSRPVLVGGIAALAVLALAAGAYVVTRGDRGSEANPVTETEATTGSGADEEAELRGLVETTVGDFTLVEESLMRDEDALAEGALAALTMEYSTPDDVRLLHDISRAESDDGAASKARSLASSLRAEGWLLAESGDVELESGEVVGKFHVLQSGSDVQAVSLTQWVVWSNGDVFASAKAPKPRARDFYDDSSY